MDINEGLECRNQFRDEPGEAGLEENSIEFY